MNKHQINIFYKCPESKPKKKAREAWKPWASSKKIDADTKAQVQLLRKEKAKLTRQLEAVRVKININNRETRYSIQRNLDFQSLAQDKVNLRNKSQTLYDKINVLDFKINVILSKCSPKDFKIEQESELELQAKDFLAKKGFSVEKNNMKAFISANQERTFVVADDTGRKFAHCWEIFYAPDLIKETVEMAKKGLEKHNYYQALIDLEEANVDIEQSLASGSLEYHVVNVDQDEISVDVQENDSASMSSGSNNLDYLVKENEAIQDSSLGGG